MPRSIIQAPNEGKTVFRIPGGEFKDEDEQQNPLVILVVRLVRAQQ